MTKFHLPSSWAYSKKSHQKWSPGFPHAPWGLPWQHCDMAHIEQSWAVLIRRALDWIYSREDSLGSLERQSIGITRPRRCMYDMGNDLLPHKWKSVARYCEHQCGNRFPSALWWTFFLIPNLTESSSVHHTFCEHFYWLCWVLNAYAKINNI